MLHNEQVYFCTTVLQYNLTIAQIVPLFILPLFSLLLVQLGSVICVFQCLSNWSYFCFIKYIEITTAVELHNIFRGGTHLYISLFPPIRPSFHRSDSCSPYLRNHHHLIIILFTQVWNDNIFGFVFLFFLILVFQTVSGVQVQKIAQNEK